jgi:hypothetical protein
VEKKERGLQNTHTHTYTQVAIFNTSLLQNWQLLFPLASKNSKEQEKETLQTFLFQRKPHR